MSIKEVSRLNQAFGMMRKKKLDVVIESPLVARYEFKRFSPNKVYNLIDGGSDFPNDQNKLPGALFICWSKKNKEALKISKDFEEGLNEIKRSGIYNKIRKEFGIE